MPRLSMPAQRLRAVKSPREIQYIRQAAQIVAQAEVSTFAAVRVGMSEIEIDRLMRIRIAELGGEDVTESAVISSVEPSGGIVLLPTQRRVQPGDLLGLDYGIQYRGYCADAELGVAAISPFLQSYAKIP